MKRIFKIVAPLVLLLTAATAVVAMAEPVDVPKPFPAPDSAVDSKNPECVKERHTVENAERKYKTALELYQLNAAAKEGVIRKKEVWQRELEMHAAAIELNDARHKLALCLNNQGKDPKKACYALANELSQLKAELAIREEIERILRIDYNNTLEGVRQRTMTKEDLVVVKGALEQAALDIRHVKERIDLVLAKIKDVKGCDGYEFEPPDKKAELPPEQGSPTVTSTPVAPTVSVQPTGTAPSATQSPIPVS